MNKIEKLHEHHYRYQGVTIVLAEGSYDPSDDADIRTKLEEICEETKNLGETSG